MMIKTTLELRMEKRHIDHALVVGVIPDAGPHLGFDLIHITKDLVYCVHS